MYEAARVGNEILAAAQLKGLKLTPLQLVKLVYIAHGFLLGMHGRPLIDEAVEAWKYGPVVPRLYQAVKKWGRSPIAHDLPTTASMFGFKWPQPIDAEAMAVIRQVAEKWGHLSGGALSTWTHREGSPWDKVYREDQPSKPIPNELIKDYFEGIVRQNKATASG